MDSLKSPLAVVVTVAAVDVPCPKASVVDEVVREKGEQISDESALAAAVDGVIAEHQDAVENYRKGNENSIKFLVGQVMRKSRGRANPQLVTKLLQERLR